MRSIGTTLRTEPGRPCAVEQWLGSGGQGDVYQVRVEGLPYALRWDFPAYPPSDPDLRERLEVVIETCAPDDHFRWPPEPVASPDGGAVGCLMLLREPRFKGMVVLVKRRVGGTIPLRLDGCLTILIRAWPRKVILTD